MSALVFAEKPSVAQAIARVIGATGRHDGYMEGSGYVVSWCFGHLVTLAAADAYDPKYSKWAYEDLPIAPQEWKYIVLPDKEKQLAVLKSPMERGDMTEIIEATDAGREGELIFRLVYLQCGCTNPSSGCGLAAWRKAPLPGDSRTCATEENMKTYITRRFAAARRIGLWVSTPPSFFPYPTARP